MARRQRLGRDDVEDGAADPSRLQGLP